MNYILAPSILAADFKELGKEIGKTEKNGAAYLHFDVMDGMFVPSIHMEACEDVKATIDKIRSCGMKAGLSICPETQGEVVRDYLKDVDMLLVMSVHPGFGGQKFILESLDKIRLIRQMAEEQGLSLDIEVDGGIYLSNVRQVLEAGANVIVAGSAVFGGDPEKNTRDFMEILREYE